LQRGKAQKARNREKETRTSKAQFSFFGEKPWGGLQTRDPFTKKGRAYKKEKGPVAKVVILGKNANCGFIRFLLPSRKMITRISQQ